MHEFIEDMMEQYSDTARLPIIGEPAPEFGANTTHGYVHFPNDYRGKWVILFSHPGDFTPVCTTEFMTFQSTADEFKAMNTELLGLSIDSVPSHMAWMRAIKNEAVFHGWKNMDISFPVIADSMGIVARKSGMMSGDENDTETVRAVFVIDPRGIVRAIMYYPKNIGRNITEIKRMIIAMQTSDAFHVATPAEWIPGEEVVIPAPQNMSEYNKQIKTAKNAWFLNFKHISPEMILQKITNQKLLRGEKSEKTKTDKKDKKRK